MISYRQPGSGQPAHGLHALLIGISDYPYLPDGTKSDLGQDYDLGMRQLSSPALSAFQTARWLLRADAQLPQPLASFQLLIAPSNAERQAIAKMEAKSDAERDMIARCADCASDDCNLEKVKTALHQWRADCAASRENVAWFYFAGHGIQQVPDDPVMLLSGFNARDNPVLGEALSFAHVFRGMEVTVDFPKMARQQHFVVDACRTEYAALARLFDETPTKPWSYKRASVDKRLYATIFGTTGGSPSYGSPAGTVLSQALLRALQGEAADAERDDASKRVWIVKHYRLLEVLQELVSQIAKQLDKTQTSQPGPMNGNVIWSKTSQTPILPVSIELSPAGAHPPEALCVERAESTRERMFVDLNRHPYTTKLEAGQYAVSVTFPPGHAYRSCVSEYLLYAQPPWVSWRIPCPRSTIAGS